jgi:hypothetical protein
MSLGGHCLAKSVCVNVSSFSIGSHQITLEIDTAYPKSFLAWHDLSSTLRITPPLDVAPHNVPIANISGCSGGLLYNPQLSLHPPLSNSKFVLSSM